MAKSKAIKNRLIVIFKKGLGRSSAFLRHHVIVSSVQIALADFRLIKLISGLYASNALSTTFNKDIEWINVLKQ